MNAEDVARYLRDNPDFLAEHDELFTQLTVPHPQHGGQAISLAERQLYALRDKIRQLELKLVELIRFGEENDDISAKVHRLAVQLLEAREPGLAGQLLAESLREDFAVPYVALELWGAGDVPCRFPDSVQRQIEAMRHPYCGAPENMELLACFGESAPHVRSVALIPLRAAGAVFGLLALGGAEPERFYAEMGTLYLGRIGELAAAALKLQP
ncbi:MAG: uncharacterized protein PWP11_3341 [Thauera sp.]|nr:DUF484 family protein [Thauera sp.]MDI3492064.1 uncharacterized protein [Thauera sp.]